MDENLVLFFVFRRNLDSGDSGLAGNQMFGQLKRKSCCPLVFLVLFDL